MIPPAIRRRIGTTSSAVVIRIGGRGLVFILAIALARELGVEGFGIYSFATTWVSVLLIISGLGFGSLFLRQTAVYVERNQPELLLGLIETARRTVIPLSIALVLLAIGTAAVFFDSVFLLPLVIALPSVVIRTFALIWEGILRGLGRVDESFFPTLIVYPVLMLAGLGTFFVLGVELTPELALALYLSVFLLVTVTAWLLANRRLKPVLGNRTQPAHPKKGRFALLVPFTTFTILSSLSTGVGAILLGLFDLPDAVGVFAVATKVVEPMMLVFGVVAVSVSAKIAGLHARGELSRSESDIARAGRVGLLWAVPIGVFLLLFPDLVLNFFGEGFGDARTSLFILVPAFLFSILGGVGTGALMMTDHQRETIFAKGVGLALNLTLCLILIPDHGASAAALALAADIVVTNVLAVILAWRLLGLNTTVFPTPKWIIRS